MLHLYLNSQAFQLMALQLQRESTLHFRLLCSKQAVYTQKSIIRRRHCPNIPDLTGSPFLIIFKLIKMNDKIKNLQF